LIALAKSKPGQLNYASSGIGTPPHLAGELFKAMAGIDIVHVPFREANSALNAVVGGNVQMMFSIATTAQSQIEAGTVRGLGVTTLEPTRPCRPAVAASKPARAEVTGWNGFMAPFGARGDHCQAQFPIARGLDDADLRKRRKRRATCPRRRTRRTICRFIKADTERWITLVEKADIRVK
jgi:tripartite-type tricarboxylate transporter receptor subunit TctC